MIYLGFPVLTEDPNRRDIPTHTLQLSKTRNDSVTGPFTEIVKGPVQQQVRPFSWFMGSRADVVAFEAFRDSCAGRLNPFWAPTWQHDLYLQTVVIAGTAVIPLVNTNYTKFFWDPVNKWRRYLAFVRIGTGISFLRRIDVATEDSAIQETITVDSAVPVNLIPGEWMLSFLTMCRLDTDVVVTHWHGPALAESVLTFRELPLEAP